MLAVYLAHANVYYMEASRLQIHINICRNAIHINMCRNSPRKALSLIPELGFHEARVVLEMKRERERESERERGRETERERVRERERGDLGYVP
jgi:hypothetical protein